MKNLQSIIAIIVIGGFSILMTVASIFNHLNKGMGGWQMTSLNASIAIICIAVLVREIIRINKKTVQQVDSAEASTNAVRPSDLSGSPR